MAESTLPFICRQTNELTADSNLDDLVEHHLAGTMSLRLIYLGMH
jgi:hypothetical protein